MNSAQTFSSEDDQAGSPGHQKRQFSQVPRTEFEILPFSDASLSLSAYATNSAQISCHTVTPVNIPQREVAAIWREVSSIYLSGSINTRKEKCPRVINQPVWHSQRGEFVQAQAQAADKRKKEWGDVVASRSYITTPECKPPLRPC